MSDAENARLDAALARQNDEICQTLGKALGYPWFRDDQRNFPGSTEDHGVCVGEHVAESLAAEAARVIADLRGAAARHDARVAELLAANNREVERRRAAEASVARLRDATAGLLDWVAIDNLAMDKDAQHIARAALAVAWGAPHGR